MVAANLINIELMGTIVQDLAGHLKRGLKDAPVIMIVLFVFLNIVELFTLWYASPNLELIGNRFIRSNDLGWGFLLTLSILITLVLIPGTIISLNYVRERYQKSSPAGRSFIRELAGSWRLLLSVFITACFYSEIFYTVFVIPHNYLQAIYLHGLNNFFSGFSGWYLNNIILIEGSIFREIVYFSLIAAGTGYTFFLFLRIRSRSGGEKEQAANVLQVSH